MKDGIFNRTKIIATIGPASDSEAVISELMLAGVNLFRLNTSHAEEAYHTEIISKINHIISKTQQPIAIIMDLQGPKLRVGKLLESIIIKQGEVLSFEKAEQQTSREIIPLDADIFDDVQPGNRVLINDGRLSLQIIEIGSSFFKAKVIEGGELNSRKGVNIPEANLNIPSLSERDIDFIKLGVEAKVDYFALSFVRCAEDVLKAREIIESLGANIPIIAKIEKPQAVKEIDAIIEASDGIMVARGDLGVEMSSENVPLIQKMLIHKANEFFKPVIVATQMLESMINEAIPTRAEASDVANAILDGADAVMLSGETSVGTNPARAVAMMSKIARVVERDPLYLQMYKYNNNHFKMSLVSRDITITRMLNDIDIKAIVAKTKDGQTPVILSKARVNPPIILICNDLKLCKKLNILWGVYPLYINEGLDALEREEELAEILRNNTFLEKQDKVMLVSGLPYFTLGKTTSFKYFVV